MTKLTNAQRKAIYRRNGFMCALCGSGRYLQIHHYIHRGQGGNNSPHNLIEEQVFVVVRLVHKKPVHAELFKSYHIILAAFRLQLFQPGLQGFLGPFQLFHREVFPAAGLHFGDTLGDFP